MRKTSLLLTISLTLLTVITATAQTNDERQVDSLHRVIPTLKGKALVDAYEKLYNIYYYVGDTKGERKAIDQLRDVADREHDSERQCVAKTALLYYYYNADMKDSVLAVFPQVHEFLKAHGNWKRYFDTWALLVNHYIFTGSNNTALQEVKKMYEEAQARGNNYGIGLASYAMGNAYMNIGSNEEARAAYERCLATLPKAEKGLPTLLDVYPYYCDVLAEMHDFTRMIEVTDTWKQYLDTHSQELGLEEGTAANSTYYTYYYISRASAMIGLQDYKEAENLLLKAYENTRELKDNSQLSVAYNLGRLYIKTGDYQKAMEYNNQVMGYYDTPDDPTGLLMAKRQQAEIFLLSRQFEQAANLYKEVFLLADSLNQNDVKNQLNEFNTLFKVNEIEQVRKEARTRHIYIILGIIILALLVTGLLALYFLRRMRQKNHELAVALDHANESDRMKTAFLQHVSHEIRTPLNIISGFAQVIGNPDYTLSKPERDDIVQSIEINSQEITNFINELLEFSENESQNRYETTEKVRLNDFCRQVMADAAVVNNGRLQLEVDCQLDDNVIVTSNTTAIRRILRQLISNAMKFTEQGSITLQTRLSDDLSQVMISVTDTGIGIPQDQQERVFEKFYKVDSFKKGLGLGLPMASRIASLLGGQLTIDKEYTQGARLILTLPNK